MTKTKRQVKPAYDYKIEARKEYEAMGLTELIALVNYHQQQAQVQGFMSAGFSMSYEAAERHLQKMSIAAEVLEQRYAAGEKMVAEAFGS